MLEKFIRFDPADLDAFAEVKEPLSGPDPTWLHKCGDGVGGLADDQPPLLRFDPQARVRTVADPLPHLRRCLSGLARDLLPPSRRGQSISGAGTAVAGRWQLAGCRRQQSLFAAYADEWIRAPAPWAAYGRHLPLAHSPARPSTVSDTTRSTRQQPRCASGALGCSKSGLFDHGRQVLPPAARDPEHGGHRGRVDHRQPLPNQRRRRGTGHFPGRHPARTPAPAGHLLSQRPRRLGCLSTSTGSRGTAETSSRSPLAGCPRADRIA